MKRGFWIGCAAAALALVVCFTVAAVEATAPAAEAVSARSQALDP